MNGNYETTELGLIPSDWEILPLRGNFDFFQNNTYSRNCLNPSKGDVQNIHYGDVLIKYGSLLDCEVEDIPFINPDIQVNLVKRLVQSGDIIIADTAEDNTVGKATEVINVGKKNIVSGLHTVFIRPHSGLFAERFLGYFINSSTYHDQLLPYIVGTKVSSVSKGSLQETLVLLPSLPEQYRIAETLSDMDALLAAMEKLIAKKRAIKQGAMQELLTGKRRLPGFEGEWIERTIDYYGTFTSGNGFPLVYQGDKAGEYPFYKVSDFSNVGNEYVMQRANNYISSVVASSLNCNIVPDSSIVFAKIGAAIFLERKRQNKGDCCIDNNMMAFTVNGEGDSQYIMYLFQTHGQGVHTAALCQA